MSIKSILCAYSGEASEMSSLQAAIAIAKRTGASVTGVMRLERPSIERLFGSHVSDALIDELLRADAEKLKAVRARFAETMAAAGLQDASDFIDLDPTSDSSVSDLARCFDLTITGPSAEDGAAARFSAHPDLTALQSGRPVLVTPENAEPGGPAERALVAWDGKRAAARALADALPLLADNAEVALLTVGAPPASAELLVRNIGRHGLRVQAVAAPRSGTIADTILEEAARRQAQLIIMGAYEHSKFSHDLFGGVTTAVIRNAPVPVFMAH